MPLRGPLGDGHLVDPCQRCRPEPRQDMYPQHLVGSRLALGREVPDHRIPTALRPVARRLAGIRQIPHRPAAVATSPEWIQRCASTRRANWRARSRPSGVRQTARYAALPLVSLRRLMWAMRGRSPRARTCDRLGAGPSLQRTVTRPRTSTIAVWALQARTCDLRLVSA